jgi:hypothetical protein
MTTASSDLIALGDATRTSDAPPARRALAAQREHGAAHSACIVQKLTRRRPRSGPPRPARWTDSGEHTRVNSRERRSRKRLHASPRELFVRERAAMKPLPLHVPEVYALHHRIVDLNRIAVASIHRR